MSDLGKYQYTIGAAIPVAAEKAEPATARCKSDAALSENRLEALFQRYGHCPGFTPFAQSEKHGRSLD